MTVSGAEAGTLTVHTAELGCTGSPRLCHVAPASRERITVPMRPGGGSPTVTNTGLGSFGFAAIPRREGHGKTGRARAGCHVAPSSVLRQTSSLTTVNTVLGGPATTRTLWTSRFGIWPLTFVHVSPPSALCRTPSTSSPTHTCR